MTDDTMALRTLLEKSRDADFLGETAELKDRSAHGLRKSAAVRLVEAGCSSTEVAAITGHASLREIERYTRAAEQEKLARAAIARLIQSG